MLGFAQTRVEQEFVAPQSALPRYAELPWTLRLASVVPMMAALTLVIPLTAECRGESPAESVANLTVVPAHISLQGARSRHRLLVSLQMGTAAADVTGRAKFDTLDAKIAAVDSDGRIIPRGNGTTKIVVRLEGQKAEVTVVVKDFEKPRPVSFHTEVVPALSRGGCSQGACHGSPQGKGGFRLSLRGFDPPLDHHSLTRDALGRRITALEAGASLILQKATARVGHQGGRRFRRTDAAYQLLEKWIGEGHSQSEFGDAAAVKKAGDEASARLRRLEVLPGRRNLATSSPRQQIIVRAHFQDGTIRDVTDLAVFSTVESDAVEVSSDGLVAFSETAEAAILVRYLDRIETSRLAFIQHDEKFRFTSPRPVNVVDRLVFAKQKQLQLVPARLCSDSVFLRRVYTDLIGGTPTPEEARRFLDSKAPDKRRVLVDKLLQRPEYAQFWALKWADIMRGNRQSITERGLHTMHRYLVRNFRKDKPFDQVAREIVTGMGNTIHVPAANFYRVARTPTEAAESLSQLFLGVRIGCAKCHNHPYESITQRDYFSLAANFARVRLKGKRFGLDDETVFLAKDGEVNMPDGKRAEPAAFGTRFAEPSTKDKKTLPGQDRRIALADWLTSKNNPYFARSTVNRVWYHLMGQGLVDPIDDFRDSNPASNPELLDALAKTFTDSGYRFKPVMRLILLSSTYQLSPRRKVAQSSLAANPSRYFTRPIVRMLSAEQLIDAISNATGVPESFPGYPLGTKAIALAEGGVKHKFLQAFTKPIRDVACDCARETEPTMNQVVHLINNPEVLAKIDSPRSRLARWLAAKMTQKEIIEEMYLATLSRRPNAKEIEIGLAHLKQAPKPRAGLRDLQHALLNSNEFLLRH